MKRLSIMFAALAMMLTLSAQDAAKYENRIAICPIVEEMTEPFPATAQVQIKNKLIQALTRNGVASSDYLNQFFISAIAIPVEKDILPGPPQQILENIEINLYIADYTNKVIFSSTALTAKGAGQNDTRAYMDAIKKMNVGSPIVAKFIEEGKEKIIAYYNAEADNILAKARALAQMKQYEEAIYLASSIPSPCSKYSDALKLCVEIYQMYIDQQCQQNLAAARAAWAAEQNSLGATEAGQYLSNILPDAACYGDAMALYKEIKAKVLDDWKFEMKQYQDGVDLESQRIKAMRDVGVAFGEHQQPTHTNIGFLRGLGL